MGRITSGVGLISGLPTQEIVDQLISIEARPLRLVENRIENGQAVQAALQALAAKLLLVGASGTSFANPDVLHARNASSSHPALITATAQAGAALGTHRFRSVRQVQTQQLVSAGFSDANSTPVGAGTITLKQGGFVNPTTSLETLNGGQGVRRGSIRITDRSGSTAVVDLSAALTVSDVLSTINQAQGVRVTASVSGDSLVLTDQTGQSLASLSVQEVPGGGTAADLGLVGTAAANILTGGDIVRLAAGLKLAQLNDKNGVRNVASLDDFRITLKNGATIDVNLDSATTIQGALDAINLDSQNGGQVTATISGSGDRLVLTDTTGGGGTLSATALNASKAARDLGILGTEQGAGVLTGGRVLAGLETVLLKSLNGGAGIANQGQVQFTSRSGASATINFSSSATLQDVVSAINAAGIGLTATVNSANNGIQITDTTGASASNLIIANVGASSVATDLGIVLNAAVTQVNGGDLDLQYISENTLLAQLNGGQGVQLGAFRITNSLGASVVVDLAGDTTVGEAIIDINSAGIGVSARINDTGDGLLLTDLAGGGAGLSVAEIAGTTAGDLRLVASGSTAIDGAFRYSVTLDADDTLNDVVTKLAASGAPASASVINDGGSVAPFRLLFTAAFAGKAGRMLVDTGASGLTLSTLVDAADAVLEVGSGAAGALLVTGGSNSFSQVVPNLTIDLLAAGPETVTVTVSSHAQPLKDAVKQFVESFNALRKAIQDATAFDPETTERGVLQGDGAALQLDQAMYSLVTGSFGAASNPIRRLSQLGVSIKDGLLVLDESKLGDAIELDADAVRQLFETEDTGLADKLDGLVDAFTDEVEGALSQRVTALDESLADLEARADFLNLQLESRRDRLLEQFLAMERALAQIQSQQSALSQLAQLAASAGARRR